MAGAGRRGTLHFGPFQIDLHTAELRRESVKLPLQEQPFQVLAALLEQPGQLVSREELRRRIWPDAVFVDFEHGLNKAINKLRRALDDVAESPRFVETLPRRGYRFIAAVERHAGHPAPVAFRVLYDDRSIPLQPGPNLIGRDSEAVVLVDASSVSRRHAQVVVSPDGACIEDLASKNGTFVGECRVEGSAPLADGDVIRVGTVRIVFHAVASGSTETLSTVR